MKPTEQQLRVLQDYLHNTLTYRESYEEIYDHILSAIEYQPENISFEDTINNIINSDFGSSKNLLKIEKVHKDALVKESVKIYMTNFWYCFKFPGVLYTIMGLLFSYYFFSQAKFSSLALGGIFALVLLFPCVIWALRLYNTGYILDTTRKSAKDKLFETLSGIPIRICIIPIAFVNISGYKLWENNSYYILSVLFVLGIIYNIALYKLYKSEFKSAVA